MYNRAIVFPVDYEVIFQHLELVRGSNEVKKLFVADIIKEVTKLKKEDAYSNIGGVENKSKGGPRQGSAQSECRGRLDSHGGLKKKPSSTSKR